MLIFPYNKINFEPFFRIENLDDLGGGEEESHSALQQQGKTKGCKIKCNDP